MDLINNFGINPILLLAQIVNFLIILYLLKRFAYKPILEVLEKRRKTIEEGQKQARQAEESLQKAVEEEKKILKNAQEEARNILSDANKQAEIIIEEAHEKGKQQVEKLIKDTKEQLERERKETEKYLVSHVTNLALDVLQSSLKGFFDEKQQKEVLERVGKQITTRGKGQA